MHFVYKLVPPRPTFASDMTADEATIMASHGAYWHEQLAAGRVLAFGPVHDPAGVWGLGLIEADDEAAAIQLVQADPAISSRLGTFELHQIDAVVREPATAPEDCPAHRSTAQIRRSAVAGQGVE